jgi:hypothetical protein
MLERYGGLYFIVIIIIYMNPRYEAEIQIITHSVSGFK